MTLVFVFPHHKKHFSDHKIHRRHVIINNLTLFHYFVLCLGDPPTDDCNTGMSLPIIFRYYASALETAVHDGGVTRTLTCVGRGRIT